MPGTEAGQPSAAQEAAKRPCVCVIAHVQNGKERARAQAALDNALEINDSHGVLIACLQLMQPCPPRDKPVTR